MRLFRYLFGGKTSVTSHASNKTEETKGLLAPEENSSDPSNTVIVRVEDEPREEVVPTIAKRPTQLYFITPDGRRSKRLPCDIVTHIMSFLCGNGFESLTADTLFTRVHPLDVAIDGTWLARSRLGYGDETNDQNGPAPSKLLRQNKEWLECLYKAYDAYQFAAFLKGEHLAKRSLSFRFHPLSLPDPVPSTIDLHTDYTYWKEVACRNGNMFKYGGACVLFTVIFGIILPAWYSVYFSTDISFSFDPLCLLIPSANAAAVSCDQLGLNTTVGCSNTTAFCPVGFVKDDTYWKPYLDLLRRDVLCYKCGNIGSGLLGCISIISAIMLAACILDSKMISGRAIPHDMKKHFSGFHNFFKGEKLSSQLFGPPLNPSSFTANQLPTAAAADQLPADAALA